MMEEDFTEILGSNTVRLSKGQRVIAQYILDNIEKAAFMTAGALGSAVNVSESTVVRFAAKLGYDGYPGMQKALQEKIRNSLTSVQRMDAAKSIIKEDNILRKVLHTNIDEIKATMELASEEEFNSCVDMLINAERIYILGLRSSSAVAGFLYYYMNLLFDDVTLLENDIFGELFGKLIRLGENDVMIAASFPRYSSQTLRVAQFAKQQNAKLIALTDSIRSPLSSIADRRLIASNKMISFVDSLVGSMSLATALIVAISQKKEGELSQTFRRLESVWAENLIYENN